MKPVSVRFKCFGPYMDEQYVDFSELEKNGLFLICGETGAGKTTVLDAICYALYCESSGGQRGDIENMRCKLAEKNDETLVEFIFDSMGKRYKFSRAMKYKTKNLHKYHNAYVWNGEGWDVLDTGMNQVTARAQRIVGLTSCQFRQVIILPQGKFEEFLVSDSKKKEEILVTLFNVQQWSRIAGEISSRVKARSDALDQEEIVIGEGLRRYGCDTPEELMEKRNALETALTVMEQASEEAVKALAAEEERYARAKVDSELFIRLDRAEQKLRQLRSQEDAMARETEALIRADAADRLKEPHSAFRGAADTHTRANEDLQKAKSRRTQAAAELEKAVRELSNHEAGQAVYGNHQRMLLQLEQAREIYASLTGLTREADRARKIWEEAEEKLRDAQRILQGREEALADAFAAQTQAQESYDEAQIAYRRSIGGILARTLEEGKRCPVCGSVSHPDPAPQAADHVSEKELDQKNKELTRCGKTVSAALQAKAQTEKARDQIRDQASQAKQILDSARNKLELALAGRISGIGDAAELEVRIREVQRQIRSYEQRGKALLDARTAAEGASTGAELAEQNCRSHLESASGILETCRLAWEQALEDSVFSGEEDFLAAVLDPARKQKRYQALARWQGDLKAAENTLEEQVAQLEGKCRPDLEILRQRREQAEKHSRSLSERVILDRKLLKDMDSDGKKLASRQKLCREARLELREDQVFAARLVGSHGVGLQRYVLGVMMNSITAQANRLLENVYGGRYRLHRTDESSGGTRMKGLELEVSDSHNNQRRSVRTLSGGEKFLVALSLAIGLSTVVQAQGEGIRLEAMFIDEGFGSLDRESVQDALDILQGVRGTAGIVGIISHVETLAETVPVQLQVTKGKRGSSCRVTGL